MATLVLLAKPLWRGVTLGLATWAKFIPLMLGPMLLTIDGWKPRKLALYAGGFAAVTVAFMLWPAIDPVRSRAEGSEAFGGPAELAAHNVQYRVA